MTASPLRVPNGEPAYRREALRVFLRGFYIDAGIGVYDHERGRLQRLVINVSLDLDPAPVEALSDTVNYETIARLARDIADRGHVGLVETFAEQLAADCLALAGVRRATVLIDKPGALGDAAVPGCEIVLAR